MTNIVTCIVTLSGKEPMMAAVWAESEKEADNIIREYLVRAGEIPLSQKNVPQAVTVQLTALASKYGTYDVIDVAAAFQHSRRVPASSKIPTFFK